MTNTRKIEIAKWIEFIMTKLFGIIAFVGFFALGILAFGEYCIRVGISLP